MSLDRFKEAQAAREAGFETALAELQAGRKTSHWIWYVFPQIEGLGRSATARFYALRDLDEACDYLRDPVLRERLERATAAVADQLEHGARLTELMGGATDSLKLVSSLTLFERAAKRCGDDDRAGAVAWSRLAAEWGRILAAAAAQGFPRCEHTLNQR
jgi:uncharacterized protein (DUF1810 family)